MTTAVYLRVSTAAQNLAGQRRAIATWLEGNAITVEDRHWYVDHATGATLAREGFERLQAAIFAGAVKHVVMYSLDRMARTMVDGLIEIEKWQERRCKMTFVADHIEIDLGTWFGNAMAKCMVAMKLAFAEAEREQMRARQTEGIAAARDNMAKARKWYIQGVELKKIGRKLGVTPALAERMATHKGDGLWWGAKKSTPNMKQINKVREYKKAGLTTVECARAMGISARSVQRHVLYLKDHP